MTRAGIRLLVALSVLLAVALSLGMVPARSARAAPQTCGAASVVAGLVKFLQRVGGPAPAADAFKRTTDIPYASYVAGLHDEFIHAEAPAAWQQIVRTGPSVLGADLLPGKDGTRYALHPIPYVETNVLRPDEGQTVTLVQETCPFFVAGASHASIATAASYSKGAIRGRILILASGSVTSFGLSMELNASFLAGSPDVVVHMLRSLFITVPTAAQSNVVTVYCLTGPQCVATVAR